MVSDYVMTEHNCKGKIVAADSVGLASYTMDSHHTSRVVVNGVVMAEGNVEKSTPQPYPVSFRALVPAKANAPTCSCRSPCPPRTSLSAASAWNPSS